MTHVIFLFHRHLVSETQTDRQDKFLIYIYIYIYIYISVINVSSLSVCVSLTMRPIIKMLTWVIFMKIKDFFVKIVRINLNKCDHVYIYIYIYIYIKNKIKSHLFRFVLIIFTNNVYIVLHPVFHFWVDLCFLNL